MILAFSIKHEASWIDCWTPEVATAGINNIPVTSQGAGVDFESFTDCAIQGLLSAYALAKSKLELTGWLLRMPMIGQLCSTKENAKRLITPEVNSSHLFLYLVRQVE